MPPIQPPEVPLERASAMNASSGGDGSGFADEDDIIERFIRTSPSREGHAAIVARVFGDGPPRNFCDKVFGDAFPVQVEVLSDDPVMFDDGWAFAIRIFVDMDASSAPACLMCSNLGKPASGLCGLCMASRRAATSFVPIQMDQCERRIVARIKGVPAATSEAAAVDEQPAAAGSTDSTQPIVSSVNTEPILKEVLKQVEANLGPPASAPVQPTKVPSQGSASTGNAPAKAPPAVTVRQDSNTHADSAPISSNPPPHARGVSMDDIVVRR